MMYLFMTMCGVWCVMGVDCKSMVFYLSTSRSSYAEVRCGAAAMTEMSEPPPRVAMRRGATKLVLGGGGGCRFSRDLEGGLQGMSPVGGLVLNIVQLLHLNVLHGIV